MDRAGARGAGGVCAPADCGGPHDFGVCAGLGGGDAHVQGLARAVEAGGRCAVGRGVGALAVRVGVAGGALGRRLWEPLRVFFAAARFVVSEVIAGGMPRVFNKFEVFLGSGIPQKVIFMMSYACGGFGKKSFRLAPHYCPRTTVVCIVFDFVVRTSSSTVSPSLVQGARLSSLAPLLGATPRRAGCG